MGRGYSNSRSKSARPTLGTKRQRSLSMQRIKESLQSKKAAAPVPISSSSNNNNISSRKIELRGAGTPRVSTDIKEQKAKLSVKQTSTQQQQRGISTNNNENAKRMRSSSTTIRQRMAIMQEELAEELEPTEIPAETIAKREVMTKYTAAGRALDEVMDIVTAACIPGASTAELCDLGDTELLQRVRGMFSHAKDAEGRRLLRGLAYPTNVSVNHSLCNHAPISKDDKSVVVLVGGDVVKIHMGCHIDGYPVSAARTIIVPFDSTTSTITSSSNNNNNSVEVSSTNADVNTTSIANEEETNIKNNATPHTRPITQGVSNAVEAARVAMHGMIHLLQPGMLNADITDFIHRVGNYFEVQALEGVLSNRTKRWVADGMECIITRRVTTEDPHQDVAECNIGTNQIWTLDVAFTDHTSYKVIPAETQATIYRRTEVDLQNDVRVRSVHGSLQEITDKHQCFPFNLKSLDNPLRARMALAMLKKYNVMDALPELQIKGERHITARFSATVAVSERRITVICGLPPLNSIIVPDDVRPPVIPEDIAAVLAESLDFAKGGQPQRKKKRTEKKAEKEE